MTTLAQQPCNRIRELRQKLGWTREQLAVTSGSSLSTIARLEQNEHAMPSLNMSVRLARALGVQLGDMIYFRA